MKKIIFAGTILLLALVIGSTIPRVSPLVPITFIAAIIILFITLVRTDLGLTILIFSMLLSPELKIAQVPQRAVVVRVDDILLFVVFFTWLAKMAIHKQFGLLKRTPINLPIASFILACVLFSARGVIAGDVNPLKVSFYILKFVEYFMLYFMFINNITTKEQIKRFIAALLMTCFIICCYSFIQVISGVPRPSAPFEGAHPEPNTLAGYLLFILALVLGFFIYNNSANQRFLLGGLIIFILFSFVQTLSRSSYLAFFPMYLTLIVLTKKGKTMLIGALLIAAFLSPILVPNIVKNRITQTFALAQRYREVGGEYVISQYERYQKLGKPAIKQHRIFGRDLTLETSAAARLYHWQYAIERWKERPFFGYGITGITFIDSQYFRTLAELGIVGFTIFSWLLITIFRQALRIFQNSQDRFAQGLCLGYLAGFVGLLTQGLAANTFIIVRIMEPFWFSTAAVMSLPMLAKAQEQPTP
ncbi:MAG: O-antigen ligase family protein [Candidatus Omnitrophica bacterium]|nr:O-antigen ligase family protein [Candidatus Omnitrophota bacterium]